MAKKAKAAKGGIVRGTTAFLALKQMGELDEKGKLVLGLTYGQRMKAPKDRPLVLIACVLKEFLPLCRYSTKEAAAADIAWFKRHVGELEAK